MKDSKLFSNKKNIIRTYYREFKHIYQTENNIDA